MASILDFFSAEAGQNRTKALRRKTGGLIGKFSGAANSLLGPTGIPGKVSSAGQIASMINPVAGMERSMRAAGNNKFGESLIEIGGVVLPAGIVAKYGAKTALAAAKGLQESLTATGSALSGAASNVATGRKQLTDTETIAQNVISLLRSGRADEVTDEMLELADDVYLYKNYDLPMDEARRKAGADEMGFNVEGYHGTDKNFQSFIPSDRGLIGPGVYVTPETSLANKFATGPRDRYETVFEFMGDYYPENSRILPLLGTNKPASLKIKEKALDARRKAGIGPEGTKAFNRELGKYDGISVERQRTYADPKNLRSKFARFDPRLKHLKNLSAAVAPVATAGLLSQGQNKNRKKAY